MNGSIRPFAGTGNTNVPNGRPAPRSMSGPARDSDQDVILARTNWANVLVVGPEQSVSNALALIVADVEHALVLDRSSESFQLPSPSRRVPTVVIRNVDALTDGEQRELNEWLLLTQGDSRVISTTSQPLFAMLATGEFCSTLYYRLNTICIDLTSRSAAPGGS